jgi:hypothetical protein
MPVRKYLNEYRVRLERVERGERAVLDKYPDCIGQRTKFGGKPVWLQPIDETPECPGCGDSMYFVAQIDSFEHNCGPGRAIEKRPKHVDFLFGDAGIIYDFYCFDCWKTETVHQFY